MRFIAGNLKYSEKQNADFQKDKFLGVQERRSH